MDAIQELWFEHGQLRGWVDQLERALPVAETCLPAVSVRVTTLADLLARHLQKEFLLIGLVSESLDAAGTLAPPARLAQDVARERERLRRLGAQLAAATPRNAAPLVEELGKVVRHLRQTLAAEESGVFPLLERAVPPAAQPDALHLFHLLSDCSGPAPVSPPETLPGVPDLLRQATMDLLTGLPNRASFLRSLPEHLARARRVPAPCAIAMADLDGFKTYNDRYGHHAGDALLAAIAGQLAAGHRGADLVARFGGDEFVLCIPDADGATAMAAAERLRKIVAEMAPADPPVTISFGVAVCPDDGQAVEALLAKADERLYAAKRRGGNRVVGPAYASEQRRHRRHDVALPVGFAAEAFEEGITRDIGLGGLRCYVSAPMIEPPVVGRVIRMALPVPTELRDRLSAEDFSGFVRVLRVQPLGRVLAGRQRFELALAFETGASLRAASA